jgi:hypothetical protein
MLKELERLMVVAKKNLLKNGFVYPVFLFYKEGKQIYEPIPLLSSGISGRWAQDKKINSRAAGAYAYTIGADTVVLIMDCALVKIPQGITYDDTYAPTTYPRSMRMEAIVITSCNLLGDLFTDKILISLFKGGGDSGEPVVFFEDKEMQTTIQISVSFNEYIREGYHTKEST